MTEGADYMAALAKDAGFQHVEIVPTDGHPGVFATLDAGAKRTLGIYFNDVKLRHYPISSIRWPQSNIPE